MHSNILTEFVAEHPVHVHLVAHARKSQDESRPPDKHDVKGSGDTTDLVFNGLTIWRNKPKERGIAEAKARGDVDKQADLSGQPDGKALVLEAAGDGGGADGAPQLRPPEQAVLAIGLPTSSLIAIRRRCLSHTP